MASVHISADRFDAVLFDLDGVLTKTAAVHAAAWKQMFDEFLRQWSKQQKQPFRPFDADTDYAEYVDGKPRYDGARSFLQSRHIQLPEGSPSDAAGSPTVCGLANRKDELFEHVLQTEGVEAYDDGVALLRGVRAAGIKTAIVSSSRNCLAVITAAGIADLFDARIDGNAVEERHLAGKPAPDTYLEAAKELGASPARAVVLEDALAGVESGRAGHFGLVVGVDRKDNADALRAHGADVALADLTQLLP